MLSFLDVFVAAFVFLLFASLDRKRRTPAVRLWMIGWLFVFLHFAANVFHPTSIFWATAQTIGALGSLVCCGVSFILSRLRKSSKPGQGVVVSFLLGTPWLSGIVLAALPDDHARAAIVCAYLGAAAMAFAALRVIPTRRLRLLSAILIAVGCTAWLTASLGAPSCDTAVAVILTEVFGLNAVLLSKVGRRHVTAASVTLSAGSISWALVWVLAAVLEHFLPKIIVIPELWNLPKYFLAAGMVLTLLEEEIRSAELASEQYRVLFKSNPHPMWMYDPGTFDFLQANEAALVTYGYSQEEFRSMNLMELFSDDADQPGLREKLSETAPQQLTGPWEHLRKDRSLLDVDISCQPVLFDNRRVMFALMHDVTERERLHRQLTRQAQHDVLTGMPNRDCFEEGFLQALQQADLTEGKAAIFCVDLDRFKQINDSYGHLTGDICLKEVALRINDLLDGRGIAGRSGGDEFLICLSNLRKAEEAESFADLLLAQLIEPVQVSSGDLDLAASIGFAVYPDDACEPTQLWRDADAAMYQAKRAGGTQWVRVSHEISSSANEANEIELGLRRALKHADLQVFYQPQMDRHGCLVGLEALLRSTDPVLAMFPTQRIVGIAEESGLIVPVGSFVIEEVCRQLREWIDEGIAPSQIAVNVSPLQLMRFDFAHLVAQTLERYQLSARMLEFEVTESTVMPDRGFDVPHQIATLARMGVRFAVDDFGTGYSSLGRLHELPVDVLKIDQSFTRRIGEVNGTFPTVQAIVALAHTLGMKIVAEGVETEEQFRLLQTLDCDLVQGFLFGRPVPADATAELLRAGCQLYLERTIV